AWLATARLPLPLRSALRSCAARATLTAGAALATAAGNPGEVDNVAILVEPRDVGDAEAVGPRLTRRRDHLELQRMNPGRIEGVHFLLVRRRIAVEIGPLRQLQIVELNNAIRRVRLQVVGVATAHATAVVDIPLALELHLFRIRQGDTHAHGRRGGHAGNAETNGRNTSVRGSPT